MNKTEPRPVQETAHVEENYVLPRVDIIESKDEYTLEAEMPGVSKDGITISLEGNELTILGRRADDTPKGEPLFNESVPSHYRRVFELDPTIDTEKVAARMEQGILTLRLPK
ncbi:MAG: Hsp20/alpha crystallin family protein, partial [Pedosphaera parvula]|nr:Hsp20/alpha crystallin family protein [Pedosphaera parvula]